MQQDPQGNLDLCVTILLHIYYLGRQYSSLEMIDGGAREIYATHFAVSSQWVFAWKENPIKHLLSPKHICAWSYPEKADEHHPSSCKKDHFVHRGVATCYSCNNVSHEQVFFSFLGLQSLTKDRERISFPSRLSLWIWTTASERSSVATNLTFYNWRPKWS